MTKKMSVTLNKYITTLDYAGKTFLVLSGSNSAVSLSSFTIVIGTPVGIGLASLVYFLSNGVVKKTSRDNGKEKTNTERLLYWQEVI